ncbi:MAG: FAD-dependent oxidoreductase [Actinomycetaceae bacterium]|nr:FAD-dependent oxidoreductase [Actinomycetaceae bacterium]
MTQTALPTEITDVDLLIIGGGKAGKSLALHRAAKGDSVAMIEREYVGGTCINVACIPTKSLVTSARAIEQARRAGLLGVHGTEAAQVDLADLRGHKEGIVSTLVGAHEKMFTAPGLDFLRGEAVFTAPKTVAVTAADGSVRHLRGARVLINTGSRPARPEIPGLWESGAWTSEDILRLEELPASLAIIGGGYIGVEFAQMMATFGVSVTLISSGEHILPREDADIAGAVADGLVASGVTILGNVRAVAASVVEGGEKALTRVELSDGSTVEAERVLVAAGRVPNTDALGLDVAGVEVNERGFIVVDDHLRTSAADVWSAGDCAGTPMFTHASWHDYRVIRSQFEGSPADEGALTTTGRLVPWTVFTTPELARIGLSEKEALEAGHEVLIAKLPTANIPRAKTMRTTEGVWKAVVDASTHRILGASLVGAESGEVITAIHMAMAGGLTYQQVRSQMIAHPTMGEGLNLLFDQLP